MTLLFDTQALLWAILSRAKLSARAAEAIADESNKLLVSAASAWEIATKVRIGKLPEAIRFKQEFVHTVTVLAGYHLLPIMVDVSLRAGRLVGKHGDPFDRMIAAQAIELGIPVLSNDAELDGFGVQRIW